MRYNVELQRYICFFDNLDHNRAHAEHAFMLIAQEHRDAVPEHVDAAAMGTAGYTIICHVGRASTETYYLTTRGTKNTITTPIKCGSAFAFPGYQVWHSTSLSALTHKPDRYEIVGFFQVKKAKAHRNRFLKYVATACADF